MKQLHCLFIFTYLICNINAYSQQMPLENIPPKKNGLEINLNKVSLASPETYYSIVTGYQPTLDDAQTAMHALGSSILLNARSDDIKGDYSENYEIVRPLLRELYLLGENSLPVLPLHFEDKKYLYSHVGGSMANRERSIHILGDEAKEIFKHILDPLHTTCSLHRVGKDGQLHKCLNYFDYHADIKSWWHNHLSKSLAEIQQEIIEWHLQHEDQIGYVNEEEKRAIQKSIESIRRHLPWLKSDVYTNPMQQIAPPTTMPACPCPTGVKRPENGGGDAETGGEMNGEADGKMIEPVQPLTNGPKMEAETQKPEQK